MTTLTVALAAVVVAIACWSAGTVAHLLVSVVAGGVLVAVGRATYAQVGLIVVLGVLAAGRMDAAWDDLEPKSLGDYTGWADLVDDPQPLGGSTRVIVEVDGQRFELFARGRAMQVRVREWRAGESVLVSGRRVRLDEQRQRRVAWQHVVGRFDVEWLSDVAPGSPVDRASNRVRELLERAGDELPGDDGSLYRGLVVGDDRDQPREMIVRFRASGLSHLTAVSGQNVSYVLMAAGPLLAALRPWWRWCVTLGLIAWFVSLTRFEPSIMRAGVMAALSATAFVTGRERSPVRTLWLAVIGLLLIDPLLVRSVGFWLSVGATWGVAAIGPWLAPRLQVLRGLATPVAVTLGAQVGVVVPAVLVFGRLPLVSIPANLLAVPVAGFVMLYGLPAGLLAGAVPAFAPVVMFPCRIGVRWVDTVSVLGERLEPGGVVTWLGWGVLAMVVAAVSARRSGAAETP